MTQTCRPTGFAFGFAAALLIAACTDGSSPDRSHASTAVNNASSAASVGGAGTSTAASMGGNGAGGDTSGTGGMMGTGGCASSASAGSGGACAGVSAALQFLGGCSYAIPQVPNFDPNKVNVLYTPGGGTPQPVLHAPCGARQCGNVDAWHYDPQSQMTVVLCPTICATVAADQNGSLDVLLGCSTITL